MTLKVVIKILVSNALKVLNCRWVTVDKRCLVKYMRIKNYILLQEKNSEPRHLSLLMVKACKTVNRQVV